MGPQPRESSLGRGQGVGLKGDKPQNGWERRGRTQGPPPICQQPPVQRDTSPARLSLLPAGLEVFEKRA